MTADSPPTFAPGTLRARIAEQGARALAAGALQPIETDESIVEEAGVRFLVRTVASLARKPGGASGDPFLDPEPELVVAGVSASHYCLLNKYSVIEHHLLIATRRFEDQAAPLDAGDFEALAACMAEYDSLGFYNSRPEAGASQPHKHLQTVPLPLSAQTPPVPIAPLVAGAAAGRLPALPFRHSFSRLPAFTAEALQARYAAMLADLGIDAGAPYNLLVTREWMLMVPRRRERCGPVAVNALGYAGSFFVREPAHGQVIRERGPLAVLREVAAD